MDLLEFLEIKSNKNNKNVTNKQSEFCVSPVSYTHLRIDLEI